jgi:hypothetical protein
LDARTLAVVAVVCGVVAVVAALLPWVVVDMPDFGRGFEEMASRAREGLREAAREQGIDASDLPEFPSVPRGGLGASMSVSGTSSELNGTVVLILSLLGAAAAGATLARAGTVPLAPRALLFAALGAFGLAFVLTLLDFLEEFGPRANRGIGLWLAVLATAGGAVAAVLALRKTPLAAPAVAPPPS